MSSERIKIFPIFYIIVLSLMVLMPVRPVVATNPDNIDMAYIYETQTLYVEVQHPTTDGNSHYIARIEVSVNSVLNQTRNYTNQSNAVAMSDTFLLPANIGDVITVRAICSISGQLSESLTLAGYENYTTTTTTTSSTGPSGIDPLLLITLGGAAGVVIIIIAIVMIKRK